MRSYHFDLGNSSKGPVGFCARVTANSKVEALNILRQAIDIEDGLHVRPPYGLEGVEYIRVYFNSEAVSTADIDDYGK